MKELPQVTRDIVALSFRRIADWTDSVMDLTRNLDSEENRGKETEDRRWTPCEEFEMDIRKAIANLRLRLGIPHD